MINVDAYHFMKRGLQYSNKFIACDLRELRKCPLQKNNKLNVFHPFQRDICI